MRRGIGAVLLLLTAGCGSDVVTEGKPVGDPYEGPLHVRVSQPDHEDPLVSSGAAGKALECSGKPYLGSTGRSWGVEGGHGSAVEALESFVGDDGAAVPARGYRVEREEKGRTLFSFDVRGTTKVAVIVADRIRDDDGDAGWGVETFAQCDPAEFPASVTKELGIQVWTENGRRVPTTVLNSRRGPEHCDWGSVTFLTLKGDTFIKDPRGVLSSEGLESAFDADASLPENATDTGYMLDRQRLWLAPDRTAAYLVSDRKVERWPAAAEAIGCL